MKAEKLAVKIKPGRLTGSTYLIWDVNTRTPNLVVMFTEGGINEHRTASVFAFSLNTTIEMKKSDL